MTANTILNSPAIKEAREHLAYIGRMMFDKRLTDAAGGNISVRVDDLVVMSPSFAGQKQQWQLDADDVLVVDFDWNVLAGKGKMTRESNVHMGLHKAYPDYGTAVMHAHPQHLMVFVVLGREMPPVQEATRKFGTTPVIEYAPAHSSRLGDLVVDSMRGREWRIKKHAAGTIAPWHGLFLMGRDLDAAFDAVERLDNNAYCITLGQAMGGSVNLETERAAMEAAIAPFEQE